MKYEIKLFFGCKAESKSNKKQKNLGKPFHLFTFGSLIIIMIKSKIQWKLFNQRYSKNRLKLVSSFVKVQHKSKSSFDVSTDWCP